VKRIQIIANLQKIKNILNELEQLQGLELKREFVAVFKDVTKEIKLLIKKKKIKFDISKLQFLNNNVLGVFDGLKDKPVEAVYLQTTLKTIQNNVDSITEELQTFKILQPKSKNRDRTQKEAVDWKDALANIKVELNTGKGQVYAEVNNEDNPNDYFNWDNDEVCLKNFMKISTDNLGRKCGFLEAPAILSQRIDSKIIEHLEGYGYHIKSIFSGYTLVSNLTVFGITPKEFDEYTNREQLLFRLIAKQTNQNRKIKLRVISDALLNGNFWYYILAPRTVPPSFLVEKWSFNKMYINCDSKIAEKGESV